MSGFSAVAGFFRGLVDIQLRTVGPQFVDKQHWHRPLCLVVPGGRAALAEDKDRLALYARAAAWVAV
jgi:hypothetical protein